MSAGPELMSSIRNFVQSGITPVTAPGAAVMPGMPAGGDLARVMVQSPYDVARAAGMQLSGLQAGPLMNPQGAMQAAQSGCDTCGTYPTYPSTANVMFRDIAPASGVPAWVIALGALGLLGGVLLVVHCISKRHQ